MVRQIKDRRLSVGIGKQYPVPRKVVEAKAKPDHDHHKQSGLRVSFALLRNQMVTLPAIEKTQHSPDVYI